MNLLLQFQNSIKQQNLFSTKDKLLLAVSGGIDSVVLCELCKQAGYNFVIAHCNFQLRGEESDRDEQFVRASGAKYAVEVLVKQFDTERYATENKISIQEAARELRYEWFQQLTEIEKKTSYTLTAHQSDDNTETISMNFFRGTGLHGLTGIPAISRYIRRPLLEFSKDELLKFAREQQLEFVEDSSNQSSKYTRNFFRNEIIPAISKVYPQVKNNLQDNINRFKEIESLYQFSVVELKKKLCKQKGKEVHIPVKQLMAYNNRALIYEIISLYGFNEKQVDEVMKLAESDSGKYIQSPTADYRIIKHRHWFIISPVVAIESGNIIIEAGEKEIVFSLGTLHIETTLNLISPKARQTSNEAVLLDAKEIQFPLLLRKRKTSDYFYPLGMKKKKKLNRFLIDLKLSAPEKEKVWVIESNQRIIWVVGYRIDERFKITENTKTAFQLTLLSSK
ncbi:MAG: tRNA lysidine(34) synthetase TilS [Chitinophagaceae bacterium]|nr:tRNA lysidine(34) synthetase TilS [Chitinophagaceae bacterium]